MSSREQEAAKELLEGVATASSTLCSDQRSKKAVTTNPNTQISPGSGSEGPNYDTHAYIYTYRLQGGCRLSSTFLHRWHR
jgi:hypothetical protein